MFVYIYAFILYKVDRFCDVRVTKCASDSTGDTMTLSKCVLTDDNCGYFFSKLTSVNTQQWAQPVTDGVHVISSSRCQSEVVELAWTEAVSLRSSNHVLFLGKMNICIHQYA